MARSAPPVRYGRDNNRYNGGISFTKDGRCLIVCRDWRLMLYSRAVMAMAIGRLLTPDELVHHRDEDPTNDELANLQIVTRSEHIAMHRDKLAAARRAKPRCKRGHERTAENTRVYNGCRHCLLCQRITERARRAAAR